MAVAEPLQSELAAAGGVPAAGPVHARLEAAILALTRHRGPDRSICPSDAARAVGGARWRERVPAVREIARRLAREGRVEVTSRGRVLPPDDEWTGPVRIRAFDGTRR